MKPLQDQTALVWDNGLFVHVAIKLREKFGKVLYGGPYVNAFPKSNATLIGDGIEGIDRILDIETWEDKADLIVFPDVMFGPLQKRLVKAGKRVFGSRMGENLELKRWETKELLKRLDMPISESHLIYGMDALRRFLQTRKGKWWIKTSRYRGDFETFEVEDYTLAEEKLDEIEHKLGKKKRIYPFVVERDIPAIVEVGYDGWNVSGQFAKTAILGKEEKDTGLIGVIKPYDELPEAVKWVNSMLSEELRRYGYAGFWSTEVRCATVDDFDNPEPEQFEDFPMLWNKGGVVPGTDMFAYLTDPCARAASPPSELYIEWYANWAEIMIGASEGVVVEPEPIGKWGAEIMLHSAWADGNWQALYFPDEIKQWIKLRNMTVVDGDVCCVPQGVSLPEFGAAVAIDDDLMVALKDCKERAEAVQGYFVEAKTDAIPKALAAIQKAQQSGVDFGIDENMMAGCLQEQLP